MNKAAKPEDPPRPPRKVKRQSPPIPFQKSPSEDSLYESSDHRSRRSPNGNENKQKGSEDAQSKSKSKSVKSSGQIDINVIDENGVVRKNGDNSNESSRIKSKGKSKKTKEEKISPALPRHVRYADLEAEESKNDKDDRDGNDDTESGGDAVDERPPSPVYQQRDRRASLKWVDFLTEEGINEHDDDVSSCCSGDADYVNRKKNDRIHLNRKSWFDHNIEDASSDEEETGQSSDCGKACPSPSHLHFRRRISSLHANCPGLGNEPHRNVDDLIFDMFQDKEEEVVLVGKFLSALEKTGLRKTDQRLKELFENLRKEHHEQENAVPKKNVGSIETLRLDRDVFKRVITDNIVLISKAFRQQFIIPEFQTFCGQIEELFLKCKDVKGGKVAAYIPQLARVDPNYWAISICTIDGQRYSIGDTTVPFTLQSCSKPLNYAIALNELGADTVHQYVGQEPSGRMFNELVLDYNKKPHNPMVNAGAIIVCSLLKSMVRPEMTLAEKFDYTHHYFRRLSGGEYMGFNNAVFLSEREAADRNYALGFYMREHKCFPEGSNLKECMDYYFQCCSMETNSDASSVMAATLANGGICPTSGEKVLKPESVRDVLSLMHSCGMYDYSGQFAFKVGLPAKSGVCGAILLVVPNVLGMTVWSPPLDALGNTVRGVNLCQELVAMFNFHKYDNLRHVSNKIDPRKHRYETKGLNIVNLLFSAASGDVTSMRRHHLSGMDMMASDYDGRTALHLAAAEGHLECVEYLLRLCHVSHRPMDRWGNLPVDDAERFGHADVVKFLREWASARD